MPATGGDKVSVLGCGRVSQITIRQSSASRTLTRVYMYNICVCAFGVCMHGCALKRNTDHRPINIILSYNIGCLITWPIQITEGTLMPAQHTQQYDACNMYSIEKHDITLFRDRMKQTNDMTHKDMTRALNKTGEQEDPR